MLFMARRDYSRGVKRIAHAFSSAVMITGFLEDETLPRMHARLLRR
jgi:hypothetical protein